MRPLKAPRLWLQALLFSTCLACAGSGSELSPLEQAEAATHVKDWELAAELWHEVLIEARGQDTRAYYETARALYLAGDPPSACSMLRQGLESFPNDMDLLEISGSIQRDCGFRRAAEHSYERLVELDPGRESAWRALARLRCQLGLERGAVEPLMRAIAMSGGDAELYTMLGDVNRVIGKPLAAFAAYERAGNLGELGYATLLRAGELSLDPVVRERRSDSLELGNAWLEDAAELAPQSTRAHFLLGYIAEHEARYTDAIANYRRAVETDPACIEALTNLALMYSRTGDAIGTADIVARALALESDPTRRAALMELLGQSSATHSDGR